MYDCGERRNTAISSNGTPASASSRRRRTISDRFPSFTRRRKQPDVAGSRSRRWTLESENVPAQMREIGVLAGRVGCLVYGAAPNAAHAARARSSPSGKVASAWGDLATSAADERALGVHSSGISSSMRGSPAHRLAVGHASAARRNSAARSAIDAASRSDSTRSSSRPMSAPAVPPSRRRSARTPASLQLVNRSRQRLREPRH